MFWEASQFYSRVFIFLIYRRSVTGRLVVHPLFERVEGYWRVVGNLNIEKKIICESRGKRESLQKGKRDWLHAREREYAEVERQRVRLREVAREWEVTNSQTDQHPPTNNVTCRAALFTF